MRIKSLVCSCALMVGLSGVAQAHEDLGNDGKFSILFGGGGYFTDSDRGLDDGVAGEIGLGYIINKHWAIEAIYTDISGADSETTGADVDADMFRLDGLYHFDRNGHWTPYLAAGIGELTFEPAGGPDSDETAINFGGGVKYALSKAASLRGDVRAFYGDEDSDLDTMASLAVTYVFGAKAAAAPLDSDGDGVLDADDRCPGTPAGVVVDSKGCALDSDLDGVPNYLDKCHSTKVGVKVDSDGCPMMASETVKIELEVLFDTNKADIKPEFMAEIQRVAEFMNQYKGAYAVIEGHTDSMGEADYNKGLSERRANAVRDVLVKKMGSSPYLAAGIGELTFEPAGGPDSDETAINFGGGVKYALSKAASLRGDVRAFYGDEDSDLDTMASLAVTYVFGAKAAAAPLDSDGDGVLDADDRCPGTPAGVVVDSKGCALDSDLDGVPNYLDKCHSTKVGVKVDSDGCPMMASETVKIELEVLFDTNKADIKPEFMAEIQRVAEFMNQYKGAYAVIEGHTDSMGEADYNKGLSERRANAVRDVLVKKMGINAQRVTAEGYGEERPRAANDTRDGRQLNRRVVAVLKAQVKKVMTK